MLGDRLMQAGEYQAAHVCYLISYGHFGSPSKATTRLNLLGCDHRIAMNAALMTPESIESFERSEAFEWARRKGNRKGTHIPNIQPLKFQYAQLLADFGHEELARKYLLSIRMCIGIGSDDNNSAVSDSYDSEFIDALRLFDDRICVSIGAEVSSWNVQGKSTGRASAISNIFKNVLGSKPEEVEPKPEAMTATESFIRHVENEVETEPLKAATNASHEDGDPDDSFITAKPVIDDPSPVKDETKPATADSSKPFGNDITSVVPPSETEHVPVPSVKEGPPTSAPPTLGVMKKETIDEPKPKEESKKEPAPMSTPAPKKEEKEKAPVSEPPSELILNSIFCNLNDTFLMHFLLSTILGSAGWFSRVFSRRADPEDKSKVADMGEEMDAYYDEKLKRWIFPGDDPAEVAKPLAPPPIMPTNSEKPPATPAPAAPLDPLAAMMAPPGSRALSQRKATPGTSRYAANIPGIGGGTPLVKSGMPPPTPVNFATFKPKAAAAVKEDPADKEN